MKKNIIKTKNNYIFIPSIMLFTVIGIFIGLNHEAWADEAQAWLIARDNSFFSIFSAVRYEGTTPLWHLILKVFITMHLKYEYVFLVSLFSSLLGVIILYYLIEIPILFKILISFSYFIAYQNSIVARSYCLVFPLMMLITVFYKDRREKPIRYYISIVLLGLTSTFGIITSCSFLLSELPVIINIFKNKKIKDNLKFLIKIIITGLILIIFFLLSLAPKDCSYALSPPEPFYKIITSVFLFPISNNIFCIVFTILFISFLVFYFKKNIISVFICITPLFVAMSLFCMLWHHCYAYYLIIALMIIYKPNNEELEKSKRNIIYAIIILILLTQNYSYIYSAWYDINNTYTGAKAAAEYLKSDNYENKKIYSTDFYCTAVQPYFEKNIYTNHPGDKSYFYWSFNNGYYDTIPQEQCDIIVTGKLDKPIQGYSKHEFNGNIVYKNYIEGDLTIIVWDKE